MVFCCLPTILKFPKVEAKNVYVMVPHTGFGIKQVQVCLLRESVSENRISVSAFVKVWMMKVSTHCCYLNSIICGEGNGTPLQYSCLENPMGGGAW